MAVIVAYRALKLGDFLTGLPALRALRRAFPRDRLVLCAPDWIAPLGRLSGAVDSVLDTAPLAPPRVDSPSLAVNLHGRGPESHRAVLACRPRELIAFRHEAVRESAAGPQWGAGEHEAARWCRLLDEWGIPADPADLDLPAPGVERAARGATVLHPGAASGARRWPVERWAAVARAEAEAGRPVLVTGSESERPLAEAVASASGLPAGAVLAGRTGLLELAAVVAAAGRVVCGDTGISHLATALGTPSVTLFGPVPPHEWGPPSDRPWHVALWAGRRGDPHAEAPDPGLLAIEADAVTAAVASLPERAAIPFPVAPGG